MTNTPADERVPIGDALPGISILPLAEDNEAVEVYALIKTRNADGDSGWSLRSPQEMNAEEFLGVLQSTSDWLRHSMLQDWIDLD